MCFELSITICTGYKVFCFMVSKRITCTINALHTQWLIKLIYDAAKEIIRNVKHGKTITKDVQVSEKSMNKSIVKVRYKTHCVAVSVNVDSKCGCFNGTDDGIVATVMVIL